MARPYKVKGEKRKKKEDNYDKEEIEESLEDELTGSETLHTASDNEAAERVVDLLAGIPVVSIDQSTKPGVIFISSSGELLWKLLKLGRRINF